MKIIKNAFFLLLILSIGCATRSENKQPISLKNTWLLAWSLDAPRELTVAVSPAGKTLRIAGSAGLVLGAAFDMTVNVKYKKLVDRLMAGCEPQKSLQMEIARGLEKNLPCVIQQIPSPADESTRYTNKWQADRDRMVRLRRKHIDMVLDLAAVYGVYTPSGILALKLKGSLRSTTGTRVLWQDSWLFTQGPVLASDQLGDITAGFLPDVTAGFNVDDNLKKRWEGDQTHPPLCEQFRKIVHGACAALFCALAMEESPEGYYYLGKQALSEKHFDDAEQFFQKALSLEPQYGDALNGLAVARGYQKKIDEAITTCRELVRVLPDYGPGWYNLAWWYAINKEDITAATPCYKRALELGVYPNKKLDKLLRINKNRNTRKE